MKRKSSNRFSFQNTVANCNEDGTELIIICSKDRSNIRQWRPTPGGQTLYTLSLPSPPSQRRCRRKAERERERYVLKRILMRERVCARPRERVHDGLTRVWQARCRCYLSVMSAHLPSRRERERESLPPLSLSLSLHRLLPASTRVSSPSPSFSSPACELFARVALLWPCSVDTSSVEIGIWKIFLHDFSSQYEYSDILDGKLLNEISLNFFVSIYY